MGKMRNIVSEGVFQTFPTALRPMTDSPQNTKKIQKVRKDPRTSSTNTQP